MNRHPGSDEPASYELRVEGHLDEHWSTWFGGMTLIREEDGTTTLRGVVTDQAELHGLLAKVRDLGTTLISVNTTDTADSPQPGVDPNPVGRRAVSRVRDAKGRRSA
jgi:hypothetical protein